MPPPPPPLPCAARPVFLYSSLLPEEKKENPSEAPTPAAERGASEGRAREGGATSVTCSSVRRESAMVVRSRRIKTALILQSQPAAALASAATLAHQRAASEVARRQRCSSPARRPLGGAAGRLSATSILLLFLSVLFCSLLFLNVSSAATLAS